MSNAFRTPVMAALLGSALAALSLARPGPATRPASSPKAALAFDPAMAETRANQAFAAEDYASALTLYEKILPDITEADTKALYEERIRVSRKQVAAAANPTTAPAAASNGTVYKDADGKAIDTNAEKRKKHDAPKAGETMDLTLHELGNFDYDQDEGGNVPDDVKKLSGAKVRVHGFMLPIDQADKVTRFMLVNDIMSCCFGGPPSLQHVLVVTAPAGKAVAYYPEQIVVEGTLKVEEKKEDGFIVSLFELDPTSIRPAAQ